MQRYSLWTGRCCRTVRCVLSTGWFGWDAAFGAPGRTSHIFHSTRPVVVGHPKRLLSLSCVACMLAASPAHTRHCGSLARRLAIAAGSRAQRRGRIAQR